MRMMVVMWTVVPLLGLCLEIVGTAPAVAQEPLELKNLTGNEFYEGCRLPAVADYPDISDYCMMYTRGVIDGWRAARYFFPEARIADVCPPERNTARQTLDIIVLWLADHPADRHLLASAVIMRALVEAWPC